MQSARIPVVEASEIKAEKEIPVDFQCPILGTLMKEPVVTVSGFTYEKSAITRWFREKSIEPLTGKHLAEREKRLLVPNNALKSMINDWLRQNPSAAPPSEAVRPSIALATQPPTAEPQLDALPSSQPRLIREEKPFSPLLNHEEDAHPNLENLLPSHSMTPLSLTYDFFRSSAESRGRSLDELFLKAVELGQIANARRFLIRGANVEALNANGQTALIMATISLDRLMAGFLCNEAKVLIDAKDSNGNTALFFALHNADSWFIKFYLKKGASVWEVNDGIPLNTIGEALFDEDWQEMLAQAQLTSSAALTPSDPTFPASEQKRPAFRPLGGRAAFFSFPTPIPELPAFAASRSLAPSPLDQKYSTTHAAASLPPRQPALQSLTLPQSTPVNLGRFEYKDSSQITNNTYLRTEQSRRASHTTSSSVTTTARPREFPLGYRGENAGDILFRNSLRRGR